MVKSIRTAGYGPVCPVVWEGGGREAAPYPDCVYININAVIKMRYSLGRPKRRPYIVALFIAFVLESSF